MTSNINEVFAGGKDDAQKEPYHLIPEIVIRELYRDESPYVWINKIKEIELTSIEFAEMVKDVLKFGADKYSANSWQTVLEAQDRYCGALFRHTMAVDKDEEAIDPESGLPHASYMLCNMMFLAWFEIMEDKNPGYLFPDRD